LDGFGVAPIKIDGMMLRWEPLLAAALPALRNASLKTTLESAETGLTTSIKPWTRLKFAVYEALNHRQFRFLLATFAAGYATLRLRKVCRVTHEGAWIQRFPAGTVVEPRLTLYTFDQIEASSSDFWMHSYIPSPGDTVLDIGAGTGWDTLAFSRKVGHRGRVISIEAHPWMFACLERMCRENKLENVTLIQAAVMDRECSVLISDAGDHLGNRTVSVDAGISVRGTTLDQICGSLGVDRIDLLKMNIEGAERFAVEGMTEVIARTRHACIACHDFIAVEGGPPDLRTKSEVKTFLEQHNFATTSRSNDPRSSVRDFLYAVNRCVVDADSIVSTVAEHRSAPSIP
jgi:FkbM family methyltransferase